MKKLQNNFTTPEQSKRLLELGVPADSADMYIECYWCDRSNGRWRYKADSHEMFGDRKQIGEGVGAIRPCWSVGRLIEILEIILGSTWSDKQLLGEQGTLLERVVSDFEDVVKYKEIFKDNRIDFSKLEEYEE